ncbi:MAG: hypothetical protein OEQ12_03105 [Nitrosopumilus sp.]|nr:hypothetical protein [Nitrosopumilus sp.]
MGNSLADYKIEQLSLSGINNIKWTQKNPVDPDEPKNKKKKRNTSPINIIYTSNPKVKPDTKKLFKIENDGDSRKSKNKGKQEKVFKTPLHLIILSSQDLQDLEDKFLFQI